MFTYYRRQVSVPVSAGSLKGCLTVPVTAKAIIILAQPGGYSGRTSGSDRLEYHLQKAGLGTLLVDLTVEGEKPAFGGGEDPILLSNRLTTVAEWIMRRDLLGKYQYGLLASGPGAAVAIRSAAGLPHRINAVVCRSGRLEPASDVLGLVESPVLLVVGANEPYLLAVNRDAMEQLRGEKKLVVIEEATHQSDKAASERFAEFAVGWYRRYLESATFAMANA